VNFNAKNEPEYIKNFKVLQNSFDKKQISRVLPMLFNYFEGNRSLPNALLILSTCSTWTFKS
jgi:hypothetical protein